MTLTASSPSIYCVRRWRKGDQERLYVDALDGTNIGFYDLRADVSHADDQASRELVLHVAENYAPAGRTAVARPAPEPVERLFPERDVDASILAGFGDMNLSPIFRTMVNLYGLPPVPAWEEDQAEIIGETNDLDSVTVADEATVTASEEDEVSLVAVEDLSDGDAIEVEAAVESLLAEPTEDAAPASDDEASRHRLAA